MEASGAGPASLNGAHLVVTGGTGFLGSAFVRHAVRRGAEVTVVAREGADGWRLRPVSGHFRPMVGSLADLAGRRMSRPPDVVLHLAAAGVDQSFDDVDTMVETNVRGTGQALQFARNNCASRFLLVGSSGEYGPGEDLDEEAALRPSSEYGATRAAASLLARSFGQRRGVDVVIVRPFAVYGPYEAPYRLLAYAIVRGLEGRPIEISSGVQTRDYVHVDDVAEGLGLASMLDGAQGGSFNLCTGVQTTVLAAATLAARLAGGGSPVAAAARPDIPGEMWRTSGNPTRARQELGWVGRTFEDGLADTVDWFRAEGRHLDQYHPGR